MVFQTGRRVDASTRRSSLVGILVKIVLLGVVDALAVYALFVLFMQQSFVVFALALAVTILINFIYLKPGWLPAKYLAPGIIFLLIFQIFVVLYSGYVAFTNYGDGHNSTKEDAIESIIATSQQRVPDSPTYGLTVVEQLGQVSFLVTDPDEEEAFIGGQDRPLEPARDAEFDSTGKATSLPGLHEPDLPGPHLATDEIAGISVPLSDDPNDGALRTPDGSNAYLYTSNLVYDEAAGTFTNTQTGAVYTDNGEGAFAAASGQELVPGWKIDVGFENFVKAFGTENIRGPLISVTLWTFAFAILSVFLSFALGLFLAIVFNDPRMRGRKFYRVIIVLPYAFPAFLSALVWSAC